MSGESNVTTRRNDGGLFWALVPVILLAASVAGVGTMASIAVRDPGFALEKNYYDRAVHWDREQAQRAKNTSMGYRVPLVLERGLEGTEIVAKPVDRSGAALRGAVVSAEAFANARADDRRVLTFSERPDGTYRALLAHPRPGLWEFRLLVEAGGARFTEVVRTDVPAGLAQ